MLDRVKYFFSQKSDVDSYCHKCMKIKINSNNDLALEKALSIQNEIIFVGPIFSINYNHYHRGVRLVKCSYKLIS